MCVKLCQAPIDVKLLLMRFEYVKLLLMRFEYVKLLLMLFKLYPFCKAQKIQRLFR